MTAKQNVLLHLEGVEACDQKDWLKGIANFQQVTPQSATIFFNIGSCYLQLQQYQEAINSFQACVERDKYLAVGYFQLGVAQTFMGYYEEAIQNFNQCLVAMRGNNFIHYKQLNLACKIFVSEVRLNLALLYLFSGEYDLAVQELQQATELETNSNHFIHHALEAVVEENWDVFGETPSEKLVKLDSNALFRPSKAKLDGIKFDPKFKKSAKVVSATNDEYSFVGFVGPVKLQRDNEQSAEKSRPNSPATPPLPSIAPPRRMKPPSHPPPAHPSTHKAPNTQDIPSPPSSSPPPLKKSSPTSSTSKTAELTKAISEKLATSNGSSLPPRAFPRNKIDTPSSPSHNAFQPKSKPPPPPKENFHFNLECNLTTSLSIPKVNVKNYNDFSAVVCEKLNQIVEEIRSGESFLLLQQEGKDTVVNTNTWKDIFFKITRDTKLCLVVESSDSKRQSEVAASGLNNKPTIPADSFDNDSCIYVDASYQGDVEDGIYYDARYNERR